jgi:hypothetical protein
MNGNREGRTMRLSAWALIVAAAIGAAGLAVAGWFVGEGLLAVRSADRFVTVKGVAEREVKADLALWPLRFVATSNRLEDAQAKIVRDNATVGRFLAAAGLNPPEVQVARTEVTDLLAQAYRSGPVESRFIVSQTLMVRTGEVDKVAALGERIGELIAAGVVLSSEGEQGPFFLFTRLNDIKPAMIADATRNARAGAGQFAADSGSRLGGIRQASQGLFQIMPRDAAPGQSEEKQVTKTVRVVTTVDYRLTD